MPRELSKCREWEKDRRERLTKSFIALSKLLPCYDPSIPLSRINILDKAASYIEELQAKVKDFLSSETVNKAEREEIKKLYERVKKLIVRNEQLSTLLKDAGIKVPSECGNVKGFKKTRPWSNRISAEQAKVLAEKENKKETTVDNLKKRKVKTKVKTTARQKKKKLQLSLKKNTQKTVTSKCVIIFSQPSVTQNCYIITNAPSSKTVQTVTKNPTVVTNSVLLSTPLVTAAVKPTGTQKTNNSLSSLGPGTLILANGSIVPVLPQNPTVIANPAPFLFNQQTLVVVTTNSTAKVTRSLPCIKPKRCTTKTVQANKVPIPALTSRYTNSSIVLDSPTKNQQPKKVKETENIVNVNNETKRKNTEEGDNVVKQQKTGEKSNTEGAPIKTVTTESKKVTTSYSIDSICKEKEGNDETNNKKDVEKSPVISESSLQEKSTVTTTTITTTTTTTTETVVLQTSISTTKADEMLKEIPQTSSSKVDEIPESVLKEIETNKNNKTTNDTEMSLQHSELSNDIFASLQVQSGGQNPESTSPTAAFLLAFPLVSTLTGVKVSEVIEEDNSDSQRGTPTLLQIGTMDTTKPTQSNADNLTPSLLNLDNFSFFSSSSFYQPFDGFVTTTTTTIADRKKVVDTTNSNKNVKVVYDPPVSSDSFVNKTRQQPQQQQQQQQKVNQSFNSCSLASSETNKISLEKSARTQESQTIQQQQQQNPVDVYNSYNYSTGVSVAQNQKNKCSYNVRSNQTVAQCNTFNPFSETVKYTSSVCCYNTVTKSYIDPLYTNTTTYSYNCQPDVSSFTQSYATNKKPEEKNYYYNYNNSYNTDATRSNNYCQKFNKNKTTTRPPVNWMTTPDIRHQSSTSNNNDYFLPCFGKDLEHIPSATFSVASNTQTTYFNSNTTSIYPTTDLNYDGKKTLDSTLPISTFQRSDIDENQFTWSPTKFPQLLDPSHSFVSSALPTLVGDLALGTTPVSFPEPLSKNSSRQKDLVRRNKPSGYDNHVNFLSVSQLVEGMPARTTNRRNSGNRSNKSTIQQKSMKRKESKDNQNYQSIVCSKTSTDKNHIKNTTYNLQQDWMGETAKQIKSSYSAEALIGHQTLSEDVTTKQRNQSNSLPVSFLTDNIIPYFPPVELQQDTTSFIQNQNCQNNTFTHNFPSTIQSNTYSSASLTTNYLPTTNFMSEIAGTTHDYNPIISENLNLFAHGNKNCMKNTTTVHKQEERKTLPMTTTCNNNFTKKTKKKNANESNNVPGFVDFSFLSMPAAINSPILPDDFHANLLPPPTPQLYSCKNPLYPKQNSDSGALLPLPPVPVSRSNIQHPEISPSVVNNVGTSLTNFNLSTIFPEINKQGAEVYPDVSKVRDYNVHNKNYVNTTQVSFPINKSTTYSAPIYSFSNS